MTTFVIITQNFANSAEIKIFTIKNSYRKKNFGLRPRAYHPGLFCTLGFINFLGGSVTLGWKSFKRRSLLPLRPPLLPLSPLHPLQFVGGGHHEPICRVSTYRLVVPTPIHHLYLLCGGTLLLFSAYRLLSCWLLWSTLRCSCPNLSQATSS